MFQKELSNKTANIIAVFLLVIMLILAVFSMKDDSATMDESGFISGGYSHITKGDYRIDIDHPPLVTTLAAFPLLFLDLNLYTNHPSWNLVPAYRTWFGQLFFYFSGNNPDLILFFARLPMIFLLLFLAWFIFYWAKELWGNTTGILVLFLFSFSPNFLANGRIVATDVGATLGIVLATYFYLKFLKKSSRKNIIFSGLSLGIALLLKATTIILFPFFFIITLVFFWLKSFKIKKIFSYLKYILLIFSIAGFLVWAIYQLHMLGYPFERQIKDTEFYLSLTKFGLLKDICLWMANVPILRPLAHYFLNVLINLHVADGGTLTVTYFFGELSRSVGWSYYPLVYLIKVPLAFHFLSLIALFYFFKRLKVFRKKDWLLSNFDIVSFVIFLFLYLLIILNNKTNIGIKHLLPIFPFIYFFVSLSITKLIKSIKRLKQRKRIISLISLLFIWYGVSSLLVFPHYLSYFNELVGGPKNGYKYVVDTNVDWGQDLRRLGKWVEKQKIEKIYVDYFGEGDINYYLGEKAIPWRGSSWWSWSYGKEDPENFPKNNYLAVSATFLQGGWGSPENTSDKFTRDYSWLDQYQPLAKIGNSIMVYYIYAD